SGRYFDNQSSDTADAYLATGLTEGIITRLGRVERLTVKSRNAVRRFRGSAVDDPAGVGRALGVAFLVNGAVRRSSAGLHVTAELVRATSGVHVWGAQYNRGDTALQAIEGEIADTIASRVGGPLAPAERTAAPGRTTRDSAAADAWMARGFLLSFRDPRTFRGVEEAFQRATVLDPSNAEAYHQYGMALLWLGRDSGATALYRRALAIDPERAITLFNLARVRMRGGAYRDARHWLDSALAVDPGADYAYALRALAHLRLGERADARVDGETAVRLRAGYRLPAERSEERRGGKEWRAGGG